MKKKIKTKTKTKQNKKTHTEKRDLTENRLLANWVPVIKYWPPQAATTATATKTSLKK